MLQIAVSRLSETFMAVRGTLHTIYSRNVEQLVLLTTGLYGFMRKQYLCMIDILSAYSRAQRR